MKTYTEIPPKELIPNLKEYFTKIFDIVEWTLEQAKQFPDIWITQGFTGWPHPNYCYNIIPFDGSIVLEQYYNCLHEFHTPLGKWTTFTGFSGYQDELNNLFNEKLGVVEIKAGVQTTYGYIGGFYYLTKDLQGNPIPKPSELPINYGRFDKPNEPIENYLNLTKEIQDYWDLVKPEGMAKYFKNKK